MKTDETSTYSGLVANQDIDEMICATLSPADQARFRAYRATWKANVPTPSLLHIDVELSKSCNMKCPMCTWSDPDHKPGTKADWMDLDHFKAIVAEAVANGAVGLGLNGISEPLMRRDLPDFVKAARDLGMLDVMMHTNGMLLTPDMSRRLIDAGLTRIFVSLDAVTQETYDKIRVGGNLRVVRDNIGAFLTVRADRTLPLLAVCFVEMSINAHEKDAFVAVWKDTADFFSIQTYMNPWGGSKPEKNELAAEGTKPIGTFICTQPFKRMRITPDHVVHPCCSFYGDTIRIGDDRAGVMEAWHGMAMQEIRTLHAQGRGAEHPVCRECMASTYAASSHI